MEMSILAARILAVIYLSAGVGTLSGKLDLKKLVEDFERVPALSYVTGFMTIVLGMLLVEYHNLWVKDWRVLVTLVGWAALVKGILLVSCPQFIRAFKGWYSKTRVWGAVIFSIGLVFGYFGFF